MKDFIVNGWTFWITATLCAALALGFNVGIGDGFFGAAIGFALAAIAAALRDIT